MTVDTIGGTFGYVTPSTGRIRAWPIVASASGSLSSLGINVLGSATGNFRVALYSTYSSSKYSGLLCQSADTPAINGWNDIACTGVSIVQTTTYYIALQQSDSTTIQIEYLNSGNDYYATQAYGAFPDPTGTTALSANITYNMRMTYTAAPTVRFYSKSFPSAGLGGFFAVNPFRRPVYSRMPMLKRF